jgi:glycine/D-amino acid oxidase-like deaminating enzyme
VVAGGEDEADPHAHTDRHRLASKSSRLIERIHQWFPRLRVEPAYVWAATFATTDDGLPFFGEQAEAPGIWFALAYGGNGITFSVIASTLARDWCEGRSNADAALFAFDRANALRKRAPQSA